MIRDRTINRSQLPTATLLFVAAVFLTSCQPQEPTSEETVPITGKAPVNDIELYYEIHGEGAPVVLLHGGLGHSGHWENQVPVLSRHYKVIAVDSRGHGRSTMTEQPISYALLASDIIALMDYIDIGKANVVGWSDGGNIGLYLAINYPDRLLKLVASGANYDPSGVRPDVGENEKFGAYVEKAAEDYQALSPHPTKWDLFLGNIGQMWGSEPQFTVEQLGGITVPILLLDGANDEAIFTEHTRVMASLIPTATVTFIPEIGHFGMWEKPDEISSAILEFLAK